MAGETPVPDPSPEPVEAPTEPDLSVAEHEAQFGEGVARPEPEPEPDEPEDPRRPPRARDDQGKFVKPAAPTKHRAKSQEATREDVPRIAELTRKLREAEAERDALKTRSPAPTEPRPTPTAPISEPAKPVAASPPAEKPKLESFQEYGDYVEALADWKIAEARRQDRATAQQEAERTRLVTSWQSKVDAAQTKYPDFKQVALDAPTRIPQGSLIDAWILEHRSGADVLYTLQRDPTELDRILSLPMFDQVEALTLLAQRTGQPPRAAAAGTGAVPPVPVKVAPRPPTPVRTSAVPAPDEPPDPETATISQWERYYHRQRE